MFEWLKPDLPALFRKALWPPIAVFLFFLAGGELFGHEPYVDPAAHFLGGMAIAHCFLQLALMYRRPLGLRSPILIHAIALSFAFNAALFWEFLELGLRMFYHGASLRGSDDTMEDLLLGAGGAVILIVVRFLVRARNDEEDSGDQGSD